MMDRTKVFFGQRVRLNTQCPFFPGAVAYIAYIGSDGVSVYLAEGDFDGCLPINWNEFDDASTEVRNANTKQIDP